jgi:hypothetical protein
MRSTSVLDEQLAGAFKLAARRSASDAELAVLREFYEDEYAAFSASPENTAHYLDVGVAAADPSLDAPALAALSSTANVVLNSPDSYLLREPCRSQTTTRSCLADGFSLTRARAWEALRSRTCSAARPSWRRAPAARSASRITAPLRSA